VGDDTALADAIVTTLEATSGEDPGRDGGARLVARALDFSVDAVTDEYLGVVRELLG
jgi:ApbE superfamily uncharacterized protein (UPF0280 family)